MDPKKSISDGSLSEADTKTSSYGTEEEEDNQVIAL